MLTELGSVIYPTSDLEKDRSLWSVASGAMPYFDTPFYVGFRVGDQEVGLDPNASSEGVTQPVAYWLTADLHAAREELIAAGARPVGEVADVGQGILLARVADATGNLIGLMQRSDPEGS